MKRSLFTATLLCAFLANSSSAKAEEVPLEILQPRALAILEASCAECHDGTTRRRDKGDFDHVLDVQQMIEGDYFLVPGDPAFSEVYAVMIEEDPDLRMPPPDNDSVYQPTEADIKLIRDWIIALGEPEVREVSVAVETEDLKTDELEMTEDLDSAEKKSEDLDADALLAQALIGAAAEADETAEVEVETEVVVEEKSVELDLPPPPVLPEAEKSSISGETLFARMHPLLVHFPVAAVPMAGFIGFFGLVLRRYDRWLSTIRWLLLFTAILAPLSVATGWLLADIEGYADQTVRLHRWSAVVLAVFTWVSLFFVEAAERKKFKIGRRGAVFFLLIAVLLAALAGHTGGELIYGEGYPFND